jgi:hypothetical protein
MVLGSGPPPRISLVDQWIDLSIEHSRLTMQMEESQTN